MKLSLTQNINSTDIIAWNEKENISHQQFLTDVILLVNKLPNKDFAINLCEERYSFMVSFAAVIVKEQTNLLPQSRVIENVMAVAEEYPDSYVISEEFINNLELEQVEAVYQHSENRTSDNQEQRIIPMISSEHIAAIAFTSGSTGKPQPNTKTWGALVSGAKMAAQRFDLIRSPVHIVATVPPQHMYGLETSILYSMQNGCPSYTGRPFYPDDIRSAVESTKSAVILITTPVHLRACNAAASIKWKNIKYIISATAPLRVELAKEVSNKMNARVMEIFGCTEAGAIASREPAISEIWSLYNGVTIYSEKNKTILNVVDIIENLELSDVIQIIDEQHFKLLGRDSDMVNIAGKRGSLADLTLKLQSIDGVDDAVVFMPESESEVNRLLALVVTKSLTTKDISTEFLKKVDSVFIPRPIYCVDKLPYNETGKLIRQKLNEMILDAKTKRNQGR